MKRESLHKKFKERQQKLTKSFPLTKTEQMKYVMSTINEEEVIQNIIEKIKRRKPYIFEGKKVSIEEANRIWKEAKNIEKLI